MEQNFYREPLVDYIGVAGEKCRPENFLWTDEPWRGRITFTGPDSIYDHRVTVEPEHRYVGIGAMSAEGTSETDYVWRAAPGTPFPRPKTARIGEIGWSVPEKQDWSPTRSARQIMLGHFRQEIEDRHSHLYQNPWYPGPNEDINPDSDAACVMNVYRSKTADPRIRSTRRSYCSTPTYLKALRRVPLATAYTQYYSGDPSSDPSQSEADVAPGQRTQKYLI